VIQTDPTLIERLVARWIGELMEPHQRLADEPDDMAEGSGIFVEDWFCVEQRSVPGNAPIQIADRQRAVSNSRKLRHPHSPLRSGMDRLGSSGIQELL
jgi:hypothetical protein